MDGHLSRKIKDVENQFDKLPKTGVHEKFRGLPYFSNIAIDHISGYTRYEAENGDMLYIFNHQLKGRTSCRVLYKREITDQHQEIRTPAGYDHTGGIQAIGKYLFVPCSKGSNSVVAVYDINTRSTDVVKTYTDLEGSSAVGITDFVFNGKLHYFLVVSRSTRYNAYVAEVPADGNMASVDKFESKGHYDLTGLPKKIVKSGSISCDGFGLITEAETNKVYMLALEVHSNEDWAYLIELTFGADGKIRFTDTDIKGKHLTNKGGIAGSAGSHFRWGAGISIDSDNNLVLLATSRNIQAGNFLDTTSWASKP